MLVNKTDAALLAGISRKTLYSHIREKGISVTKDNLDGLEKIDLSELERVYGLEKIAANRKKLEEKASETNQETDVPKHDETPSHMEIRIREQAKEIEKLEELLTLTRSTFEQRVEDLEETITESREKAKTFQMLLEDHSKRDKGAGDWEKQIKALEARLSNQIDQKDRQAEARIQSIRKAAKKKINEVNAALEKERNKNIIQKIFG